MARSSVLVSLFVVILASILLFKVKYTVMDLEEELASLQRDMFRCEENLHILRTEYAYLSSPSNIQKLAREKLGWNEEDILNSPLELGLSAVDNCIDDDSGGVSSHDGASSEGVVIKNKELLEYR